MKKTVTFLSGMCDIMQVDSCQRHMKKTVALLSGMHDITHHQGRHIKHTHARSNVWQLTKTYECRLGPVRLAQVSLGKRQGGRGIEIRELKWYNLLILHDQGFCHSCRGEGLGRGRSVDSRELCSIVGVVVVWKGDISFPSSFVL